MVVFTPSSTSNVVSSSNNKNQPPSAGRYPYPRRYASSYTNSRPSPAFVAGRRYTSHKTTYINNNNNNNNDHDSLRRPGQQQQTTATAPLTPHMVQQSNVNRHRHGQQGQQQHLRQGQPNQQQQHQRPQSQQQQQQNRQPYFYSPQPLLRKHQLQPPQQRQPLQQQLRRRQQQQQQQGARHLSSSTSTSTSPLSIQMIQDEPPRQRPTTPTETTSSSSQHYYFHYTPPAPPQHFFTDNSDDEDSDQEQVISRTSSLVSSLSLSSTISTGAGNKEKDSDSRLFTKETGRPVVTKRVRFLEHSSNSDSDTEVCSHYSVDSDDYTKDSSATDDTIRERGNLYLIVHEYEFPWETQCDYWYSAEEMDQFRLETRRDTKKMVRAAATAASNNAPAIHPLVKHYSNNNKESAAYVRDFQNLFQECQRMAASPLSSYYNRQHHDPYYSETSSTPPMDSINSSNSFGSRDSLCAVAPFDIPAEFYGLERFQKYIRRDKQGILELMRRHTDKYNDCSSCGSNDDYHDSDSENSLNDILGIIPGLGGGGRRDDSRPRDNNDKSHDSDDNNNSNSNHDDADVLRLHCERLSMVSRLWAQQLAILSWETQ